MTLVGLQVRKDPLSYCLGTLTPKKLTEEYALGTDIYIYIQSGIAGGDISKYLGPESIELRDDPEENRRALCLRPPVARLGGSGKIVSSRNRDQTRSRAPTDFKIQPPTVTPLC